MLPVIPNQLIEEKCQDARGFSTHCGILIIWDSDFDSRITDFLDRLDHSSRESLMAVYEHKASLVLFVCQTTNWLHSPLEQEIARDGGVSVQGDFWSTEVVACELSVREWAI